MDAAGAAGADDADTVTYAEGTDPDRIALDQRIRAHAKAKGLSYAVAAQAVANKAPNQ